MHDNLLRRFSKVFFKKMILKVSHKEKIDILRKKGLKIGKIIVF
jgi:hypothetical protein